MVPVLFCFSPDYAIRAVCRGCHGERGRGATGSRGTQRAVDVSAHELRAYSAQLRPIRLKVDVISGLTRNNGGKTNENKDGK